MNHNARNSTILICKLCKGQLKVARQRLNESNAQEGVWKCTCKGGIRYHNALNENVCCTPDVLQKEDGQAETKVSASMIGPCWKDIVFTKNNASKAPKPNNDANANSRKPFAHLHTRFL